MAIQHFVPSESLQLPLLIFFMLTDNEKATIELIQKSLHDYAFGDIVKSRKQNMLIGSFALCFCFVNALSAHRYFNPNRIDRQDKIRFVNFIKAYFDQRYHQYAEQLYTDLRSRLVHNYAIGKKFAFTEGDSSYHLRVETDGTVYLLIDQFIIDIDDAFKKYLFDLHNDPVVQRHALDHYAEYQILAERSV